MSGIRQLSQLLHSRKLTALELCERCIEKTRKWKHLNMYVTVSDEVAMTQAKESDDRIEAGQSRGMFEGIPFAVKDNFSTTNIQTSCASKMLLDYKPVYDATVVKLLRDQGAVLIGKTNMDEFAMGCGSIDNVTGSVKNPWGFTEEKWNVSGGSSGGSAVSVATGTVSIALGSDTGGSVRNPASYCGVVGLKPTYGAISRHGLIPLVNSLDCPAIITRTVDDCVLAFDLLCQRDTNDSTSMDNQQDRRKVAIQDLTIGIPIEYHSEGLSKDVLKVWCEVADKFSDAGANVVSVSLPHTLYAGTCYAVVCTSEVASNMARYDGLEFGYRVNSDNKTEDMYSKSRHIGFNDVVRGRILAGNYFLLKENYETHFKQAQKVRRLITDDFNSVFTSGVDILLTPTVQTDAPDALDFVDRTSREILNGDGYTQAANLAGVPACSVPSGLSSRGLPIGLQLIGPLHHDKRILQVAQWLEDQNKSTRLAEL